MSQPLLTTKLYIPPPRPTLIPRARLINQLDTGLTLGRRLTLVSAPAGSGKTTLIGEWVAGAGHPVAWLSLDEGDNDPVQFIKYLIAALQQVDEQIGEAIQHVLQSPQIPPAEGLVTSLINDIVTAGSPLTLVLDDCQFVTSMVVHKIIRFLVENQPPFMHVVISTREDPPLPLPQFRAQGDVTEIRERDLRFTVEEAALFLNESMGLPLSIEAVQALEARTEGWIVGLQLAALAMQQEQGSIDDFIAAFTGNDRYIMDYLISEVIERQPEELRDFLRQTAVLDRMTASLCNALTGREDGQAILERMDAANLFLIPLDNRREWYRYHRLFAEFLRMTLSQDEAITQHQKAAHWYESQGMAGPAIQHALIHARLSKNYDEPVRLIGQAVDQTMHQGNILTVGNWLDALPDERVKADGVLRTYRGWVLAMTGEMELAEKYANAAETQLDQTGAPPGEKGKLLLLRAFVAVLLSQDYARSTELAQQALELLEENQAHWRVIALWVLAESQERTGSIQEAVETFRTASQAGRVLGDQVFASTADMSLASALNNCGRRREAVAMCEEAIQHYTNDVGRVWPVAGLIISQLGRLYYESNQLELADETHSRSLALSGQHPFGGLPIISRGLSAPTRWALGETGEALEALKQAYQFASQTGLGDPGWFLAMEANIRLRQGDLPFAQRWAETVGVSLEDEPQYLTIEQNLVYARLLLAQNRLDDARHWLDKLARFTQEHGLYRWLITIQILQAIAASRNGEEQAAHKYLSSALEGAAPENYYRAFLDEDVRIISMLREIRQAAPLFVDELLAYAEGVELQQRVGEQPLIEPLSERELEVLNLIAAGLTNAEIAERLFIAVGTVKRHINHIYGKLEVTSRTQAIARARQLRLLD